MNITPCQFGKALQPEITKDYEIIIPDIGSRFQTSNNGEFELKVENDALSEAEGWKIENDFSPDVQ